MGSGFRVDEVASGSIRWFPEQKITVHEAIEAYTINNAYAAFEDDI